MKKFEKLIERVVPWFIAVCLFVILWAVTGCERMATAYHLRTDYLKTVEYDGCEYVTNGLTKSNAFFAHKGNCKNPIHKCDNQTGTK